MKKALTILLLLMLSTVSAWGQEYRPPHDKPGPATDVIRVRAYAEEIAPQVLERGDIDLYLYNMRVSRVQALENNPGIKIVKAPSLLLSIILNPAPDPTGLTPF
ncbi:MAG: hypothetical protein QXM50_04475, partial [Candidatus Caldarchaeum sp.]